MSDDLNILTIGAGAIGTYIGGSLALKGHRVEFVERPDVAEGLRQQGLRLLIGEREYEVPSPKVYGSVEDALKTSPFDLILFALKSFDTGSFIESLPQPPTALPPMLCLSNGVENETMLAKILGSENIISGTVTSAIGRRDIGSIVLERLRGVGVAAGHSLSERLVTAFDAAGLNAQLFQKPGDMKWSKMLTNLLANASSAILNMTPGDIFGNPRLFRFEMTQLREALAVMKAQNIRVVNLPGTPVRLLAFTIKYLPAIISRQLLNKAVGSGRGGKMPSFHIDLYNGRGKSEVDYLNGAVVRAGERYHIPTPANKFLTEKLKSLTNGVIPLDSYLNRPDKFMIDFKIYETKQVL